MSADTPPDDFARDQATTSFSRHLEALLKVVPEALCAVFVDAEGEAVDLAARTDPFDARIAAAELAIVMHTARAVVDRLGQGTAMEVRILGASRTMLVRHVSEGYDLVLLLEGSEISAHVAAVAAMTAIALLIEADLPPPAAYTVLRQVERRTHADGSSAPASFENWGVRRTVEAVLGRRDEGAESKYLVRLETGEELVMIQDRDTGLWKRG